MCLVEKLKDKVTSEDVSATTDTLGATHLDSAVLSSVDGQDVLLYTKAAMPDTRGREQHAAFSGRAFYS